MRIAASEGAGRVSDLGGPGAGEVAIKSRLVALISEQIERQDLTLEAAGQRMGVRQGDLSKMFSGTRPFSVARLLRMAQALGADVDIRIRMGSPDVSGHFKLFVAEHAAPPVPRSTRPGRRRTRI